MQRMEKEMKRKKESFWKMERIGALINKRSELAFLLEGTNIRLLKKPIFMFLAGIFLGGVRLPFGVYPFAGAILCASSGGLCVAGAFLGGGIATLYRSGGGVLSLLILALALVIRLGACFMKGDFRSRKGLWRRLFCERGYIRVVAASLCAACEGCIAIVETSGGYYGVFSALAGIGVSVIITSGLISLWDKGAAVAKRSAGLIILLAGISCAVCALGFDFNGGAVAAFWIALWMSEVSGSAMGVAAGFACTLPFGVEYCAAFASIGIIYSLSREYSKILGVIASGIFATVISFMGGGISAIGDVVVEIAFGVAVAAPVISLEVLKLPCPDFLICHKEMPREEGDEKVFEKLSRVSASFSSIAKLLRDVSDQMRLPSKSEAYRICTATRARFCGGCIHENECTGVDEQTVTSMFKNMEYRLVTNGHVSARIVPESVAARCFNIDSIIESINASSKRYAHLSGVGKRAGMFASDYSSLAALIGEMERERAGDRDTEGEAMLARELGSMGFSFTSASVYGGRRKRIFMRGVDTLATGAGEDDIRECASRVFGGRISSPEFIIDSGRINAVMRSEPSFKMSTGRCAYRSQRDNMSGDSVCSFENEEGFYYSILSDGMGSGREAAITSAVCASFLEKLLGAGCPMRSTLELLNTFIRGTGGECFTTVDLMEADLYTGRARFIKSGAAPSFVIRNGKLFRLHSKTVPVGIMRALDAEAVSFDLCEGDTVVMMSDGVTGSYEDCPWLYELLCSGLRLDDGAETIARAIAKVAAEKTQREDDITVCVMKVSAA